LPNAINESRIGRTDRNSPGTSTTVGAEISRERASTPSPQASFGGHEMYPEFLDKAAVLAVRIARNHPLPDGNKRLSWACLNMFCALNGRQIHATENDAVDAMLAVAAVELDEEQMAEWLAEHLDNEG
jgi:death-on-curing family protein